MKATRFSFTCLRLVLFLPCIQALLTGGKGTALKRLQLPLFSLGITKNTLLRSTSNTSSNNSGDDQTSNVVAENSSKFVDGFVEFMNESCSAFHAVEACKKRLLAAGFTEISEKKKWDLERGGKYFFTKNGTTIIAFVVGKNYCVTEDTGMFTVLAAHTDSPCLKIKPVTCLTKEGVLMLNTQPYGGGLWHTWFDRDLGLAGRALVKGDGNTLESKLFRIDNPIARIPNLAIHLQTPEERSAFNPNLHDHVKAILSMDPGFSGREASEEEKDVSKRIHPALLHLIANSLGVATTDIEDLDMQLTDVQPTTVAGPTKDLVYSGRLDNLCSTYQCLMALLDSDSTAETVPQSDTSVKIVMLFDHEEVGSTSFNGAGSSLFMNTIRTIFSRLSPEEDDDGLMRALGRSFVASVDMAHALHPNYAAKHDKTMAPVINGGTVIKHNCNQRYATNSVSATLFRRIGKIAGIPVQEFSVRADCACGSTIGPVVSALSGILTVDCGSAQYSMHSIREMMGAKDIYYGYSHLKATLLHHPRLMPLIE